MQRLSLTESRVKRLASAPPGQKRSYYYDSNVRGFCVAVSEKGRKLFVLYRKVQGRPERISIGTWPELPVEAARREAQNLIGQIIRGENPAEQKRTARGEMTLGELFQQYLELHARPHKKPRSVSEDLNNFRRYLAPWEKRKLSTIHRRDVQRLHAQLGDENGICPANRTLALLSTMWNKAVEWGWPGISPVRGIKKFPEKARKRFLKPDEMQRFFQVLAQEPNQTFAAFVLLCLFTGAREGNVLAMRWADVDLSDWMWSIRDTKNNEPQEVPVVPAAAEVLKRQKEIANGEWVLPGRRPGTHLTGFRKNWSRLLKAAGIVNLRIHDLRRSMGSWGIREKVPLVLIKDILGHKTIDVTARVYALGDLTQVREAMTTITGKMLKAGERIEVNEV